MLLERKSFVNVVGFRIMSISGRLMMILFRDKLDAILTI